MNKINLLEENLKASNQILHSHQSILAKDPNNLAYKLSLATVEKHIIDLQNQLRVEKELREKEIIKIKLKGPIAQEGSIPLYILGELSNYISGAILSASQSLKSGEKLKGKIPKNIIETLDLRFVGISAGSTCIYITGKTSPDLFGRSLLESSLKNTFFLLSSKKPNQLSETISKIGIRSTKKINRFLKLLSTKELDVEMTWRSPSEVIYKWQGTKDIMLSLSNSLESIKSEKPEIIGFEGELIMASVKGQYEILDIEEKTYKGNFLAQLLNDIKQLHIGQNCSGKIEKKSLINKITGYKKNFYTLLSIKPRK